MKIALSAQGSSPESPLDPRFGRAQGFMVYDTETKTYEYLDNTTSANLSQGAGIQAAQMVVDAGTTKVITGRVGPKAEAVLKKAGIEIILSDQDTVEHAIAGYQQTDSAAPTSKVTQPMDTRGGGRGMGGGGGRGMGGGGGRGMGNR